MRRPLSHDPSGLFEPLEPRRMLAADGGGGELPFTYYYPEGFAHDGISEFVPITNTGDAEVRYELHARYETGDRDAMIASGVIPANTRGGVTINTAGDSASRLVRPNTPYALVLRTSAPVGATMSHYDFGTAVGESFTAATSTEWSFAEGYKDSDWTRDFVLFYNTSDDDAVVTMTAFTGEGEMITATTTVGAQRRGGWSLNDDDRIPQGVFGIRLVASKPIVAALSHYEVVTGRGFGAVGTADGGALAGIITAIDFDDDNRRGRGGGDDDRGLHQANAYITILNTNDTEANVTLTFIAEDDDAPMHNSVRTLVIPAQSRGGVSIRDLGFPIDDEFGVLYRSDVKVTATAAVYEGRDATGVQAVDAAATEWKFGEGFMSRLRAGRSVTEDVYLFNPTGQEVLVRIDFFFSTGQTFTIFEDLDPFELDDEDLHVLPGLLNAGENVFYGIKVSAQAPIVATLEHWDDDLGGGFATAGTPGGEIVSLHEILAF